MFTDSMRQRWDAVLIQTLTEPKIVEVVDYSAAQTPKPVAMSKRELKAFMVRPKTPLLPPLLLSADLSY